MQNKHLKLLKTKKQLKLSIEEKNLSKQGLQYLFMHVADENKFLSHYETIIIYKTIPFVIKKENIEAKL